MTWANQYVGIPYLEKGRSREGADCWGLVRLILLEQTGLELPSYSEKYEDLPVDDRTDIKDGLASRADLVAPGLAFYKWSEVDRDELEPFDSILFTSLGELSHIGLVIRPTLMIHSHYSARSSVVADYGLDSWQRRIVKCYRPQNPHL